MQGRLLAARRIFMMCMENNEIEFEEQESVTPGAQWAQRLGVVGGLVILLFSLVFVLTMLTAGPEKLEYVPLHDTAYYAENLPALQSELEAAVFPHVEGVQSCEVSDGKLVIGIRSKHYIETRAVIIDVFDRELFVFEQK